MIGKMYRPTKIKSLVDKRGFQFIHKYKSNFGGFSQFKQNIHLYYDWKTKKEYVRMDFEELDIPLILDPEQFEWNENTKTAIYKNAEIQEVNTVRRLKRPSNKKDDSTLISSQESLFVSMEILSDKEEETDMIEFTLKPIKLEEKEYLKLTVSSKSLVEVQTNTSIIFLA